MTDDGVSSTITMNMTESGGINDNNITSLGANVSDLLVAEARTMRGNSSRLLDYIASAPAPILACPCNCTYFSAKCCLSESRIVWEDQRDLAAGGGGGGGATMLENVNVNMNANATVDVHKTVCCEVVTGKWVPRVKGGICASVPGSVSVSDEGRFSGAAGSMTMTMSETTTMRVGSGTAAVAAASAAAGGGFDGLGSVRWNGSGSAVADEIERLKGGRAGGWN